MSTRSILTAVGYVVGAYFGYPELGAVVGGLVGGALTPDTKQTGPRLTDLKGPSSSYGTAIPYIEGSWRTAGTFIYASSKREIAHESSDDGKGGPSVDTTTFTYEMDVLVLLSINKLVGVRRIWSNGKLIWSSADDADAQTLAASSQTNAWRALRFYSGDDDQLPDPVYEAAVGAGNAPAYRGRATLFIEALNLGGSGQLPILNFEVCSNGTSTTHPAVTRLQSYFDLSSSEDISEYEAGPGALGFGVGFFGGSSLVVDSNLAGDHSLTYDVSSIAGDGVSPITIEFFATRITTPAVSTINIMEFFPDLGSPGLFTRMAYSGSDGFLKFSFTGAETAYLSDAPLDERPIHFAVVYGATSLRAYIDGVKVYESPGSAIPALAATGVGHIALGDPYGFSDPISTNFSIDEFAVRFEETYTGNSFSPPGPQPANFDHRIKPPDTAMTTLSSDPVSLDGVVSRLCLRTGLLAADDIDVTDLEGGIVRGLAISQVVPTRQAIELLMSAYLFEAVEGSKIRFVKRGAAPALTIPYRDLGATAGDSAEPLPMGTTNDRELPRRVTVKYSNALNDFQDGAESGDRLVTQSTAVTVVELTIVFTPTEAKRVADVNTMDLAVSVNNIGPISTTRKYSALECTDVLIATAKNGSTFRARIQKVTQSAGLLTYELVLDDATVINSVASTGEGYFSSSLVREVADTTQQPLDIPILRDVDNDGGFYDMVKPVGTKWAGAVIYSSPDDVTLTRETSVTDRAIFGAATTALNDWTGARILDDTSSVTVNVGAGALTTSTRDAVLNDESINAFALGVAGRMELGQFIQADLISTGVYKLSRFLRGSRGTEWAMTGHLVGDKFALLSGSGMRRIGVTNTLLGMERFYRAVSIGKSIDSVPGLAFTNNGVGMKPFSPFDVRATRDAGSGEITLTWQRRTRLATRIIGPMGISIPLGELGEAYAVDVFSDNTYTTVLRTLNSTVAFVNYSGADQTSDFGSFQSTIYIKVYQLSAVVGRGYPLQAAA